MLDAGQGILIHTYVAQGQVFALFSEWFVFGFGLNPQTFALKLTYLKLGCMLS